MIVVDKPAGLVVHPGAGQRDGTLVTACWPATPSSPGSASPTAPASSTASTRARRGCWWWPAPRRPTTRWSASWRPTRSSGSYLTLVWGTVAAPSRHDRRPHRPVVARPAPAWRSPHGAERPAPRYEVVAALPRARSRSPLLALPARDRAHPPDPGAPGRIGHPVVGDARYGGAAPVAARCRARSCTPSALGFDHPVTRRAAGVRRRRCPTTSPAVLAALALSGAAGASASTSGVGDVAGRPAALAPGHGDDVGQGEASRGGGACGRRPRPRSASSTHWPSWSQAPSWWGSPKSPTAIGPSTALTISPRVIVGRVAGQHVAAADAALGAHQAGALQGQQDLLEVGLGEPGALGDVAHRGRARLVAVQRQREQRPAGVVAPGRHLHTGNCRGCRPANHGGAAVARRATAVTVARERKHRRGRHSLLPDYGGPCITQRRARAARPPDGRPAWLPGRRGRADQVVLLVLDGLGWEQLAGPPAPRPDPRRDGRRARSPPSRRPPRPRR